MFFMAYSDSQHSTHNGYRHGRKVPKGRLSRLAKLGGVASRVAGNMLQEGAKQWAQGKRPKMQDLLLTADNARKISERLAHMRGAAMKLGQLISMDAGDMLPKEFSLILEPLRNQASPMPLSQLNVVLEREWGKDWLNGFEHFSYHPIAAASIGQVHKAQLKTGETLAIKVQYPGVRDSISSDVDNVASLLRISGLVPKTLEINNLLDEAKAQLHQEADYVREAQYLNQYRQFLESVDGFTVPVLHEQWSNKNILAMSYHHGMSIDQCSSLPQGVRDSIVTRLFELLMREMFDFHLLQTDPNFANYFYQTDTDNIVLLDFGACRQYLPEFMQHYRELLQSSLDGNRQVMLEAAQDIGYFQEDISQEQLETVLQLFEIACEPIKHTGAYDFANNDLPERIREKGLALSMQQNYWHSPPVDSLFLHRKFAGLYLLASRLRARVDVQSITKSYFIK